MVAASGSDEPKGQMEETPCISKELRQMHLGKDKGLMQIEGWYAKGTGLIHLPWPK